MKKHYYYPAVLTREKVGGYSIRFPDFDGCFTQGETIEEVYNMAVEAIGLWLEDNIANDNMPDACDPGSVKLEEGESFVALIDFQPEEYLRRISEKSVKKTLTIPSWLNELAYRRGLNFSQILQEGLKIHLGLMDAAEVTE